MKRILSISLILATLLVMLVPTAVFATQKDNPANDKDGSLYLYEKDADWNIVWGGAWGKLNYKIVGDEVVGVFNGHKLNAGQDYTLITYIDPWAGTCLEIGSAIANRGGNVHIAGSFNISNIDTEKDLKIWLVLSEDFDEDHMIGWNPSKYLFEHNLFPLPD